MGAVMLALTPATAFALWAFGWPAVYLFAVTVAAALAAEALCLLLAGRPVRAGLRDGSALLTGWLLALTLPPWAPWWIGVVGAGLAIVVAKQIFGGLGQNVFNPAMVARVALLVAFPVQMTTFVAPVGLSPGDGPGPVEALAVTFGAGEALDAVTGASVLGDLRTALAGGATAPEALAPWDPGALALGAVPGSLGETSAALLLLGGLWLLGRGVITWHVPVSLLGTVALLATGMHLADPQAYPGPLTHLLSGALVLGAFFIATDPVTSPVTARGQLLFGTGCGVLVFALRTWSSYPEGVAFAVLLMNATTPLIDHWLRPRIHGRGRAVSRGGERAS
jgi:electron transport complex protein RnfD